MLRVTSKCSERSSAEDRLALDYDSRRRSRMRTITESGRDIALLLPRGTVLHHGDLLRAEDGTVVFVEAVAERLSRVECPNAALQARAAYHLGNRHVALQIDTGYITYQTDPILDRMLKALGYQVEECLAAFEPEPGAYRNHEWGDPIVALPVAVEEVSRG